MSLGDGQFTWETPGAQSRDPLIPRFYLEPIQNAFKSERAGQPVYDEVEMVQILGPGIKGELANRMVKAEDKERWPQQYAKFKAGQEAPLDGYPLKEWPVVGKAQILELEYHNVRTVEQLAGLSDANLSKAIPMGGTVLRQKAIDWLEQKTSSAPLMRLEAENLALREEIEDGKRRFDELAAKVATMSAKPVAEPAQ